MDNEFRSLMCFKIGLVLGTVAGGVLGFSYNQDILNTIFCSVFGAVVGAWLGIFVIVIFSLIDDIKTCKEGMKKRRESRGR